MYKLAQIRDFLPFTYITVLRSMIKEGNSILDVGCGKGELMIHINCGQGSMVVGVDLCREYLLKAKALPFYTDCVCADVRFLPFRPGSFDTVLFSYVIEHLQRDDGFRIINNLEAIAKNKVIIVTHVGPAPANTTHDSPDFLWNPLQKHRSYYNPFEFIQRGYKVRGIGNRFFFKFITKCKRDTRLCYVIPARRMIAYTLASYLFSIFNFYHPNIAESMVCVKSKGDS